MKEPEPKNNLLWMVLGNAFIGLALIFASILVPIAEIGFFIFASGAILCCLSCLVSAKQIHWRQLFKKPATDKSGIIYVWAVGAIFLFVIAFVWFAVGYPVFMALDTIEENFTFPAEAAPTILLIRAMLQWLPVGAMVAIGIWMFVNSMKREDVTYG